MKYHYLLDFLPPYWRKQTSKNKIINIFIRTNSTIRDKLRQKIHCYEISAMERAKGAVKSYLYWLMRLSRLAPPSATLQHSQECLHQISHPPTNIWLVNQRAEDSGMPNTFLKFTESICHEEGNVH